MELNEIKEIIRAVKEYDIDNISLELAGIKLFIKNKDENSLVEIKEDKIFEKPVVKGGKTVEVKEIKDEENIYIIKSPLVGEVALCENYETKTDYKAGDKVKKGDVLCTIEAMKLCNEVSTNEDGTIEEILIKANEIVEYGKSLFKIRKDKGVKNV